VSRSKRLVWVADATRVPSKGEVSAPQIELLQALVLLFLVPDVLSDHLLVPSHCGDVIPFGPEVLTYAVSLPFPVHPGQVDRTLSLDEPHDLRHRVLRWDRYHHVHVIRHEMSLFDPAVLLCCQTPEYLSKMRSQLDIQRLPATFGNEDHVVFAVPFV
jgi:hypothetical protein